MKTRMMGPTTRNRKRSTRESGVALIIALLALLIISTLAAGLMFSTQTEVWTNANYRTVTQARYVAEAGAQQAAYWITHNWTPPSSLSGSNFNLNTFPITYLPGGTSYTCAGSGITHCVVLAPGTVSGTNPMPGIADTYNAVDSTTDSAFQQLSSTTSPFSGSGLAGSPNFVVAAQLLSATYHADVPGWETSWKIISQGTVGGVRSSKVQVVETILNKYSSTGGTGTVTVPAFNFGAFANSTACSSLVINGSSNTLSYDSSKNKGLASPSTTNAYGDIATLGNLNLSGSGMVYGNVYAPGYNVGDSSAGAKYWPYGVSGGPGAKKGLNNSDACSSSWKFAANEDNSGSQIGCTGATCTQKAAQLPVAYTSPYPSANIPDSNVPNNTSTCSYDGYGVCNGGSGGAPGNPGTTAATPLVLPPSTTTNPPRNYGQVNFASNTYITLNAGVYYFDTLTIGGSTHIRVGSAPVQIYILNKSGSATPINITGGSETNQGGDPNDLSLVYNGTNTVNIGSISSNPLFATIYAPNANISFNGNGSIYGAVIGSTVSITGGGHVIYDTHLALETPHIFYTPTSSPTLSPYHVAEFSWSAF